MGTGKFNAGCNPAMDKHPIERKMEGGGGGGVYKYSKSLHATETGMSTGLMSHLARMQALSYYFNSSGEFPYMPALLFALLLISELPYMRYYLHVTFTSLEFNQNSVT